MPGYLSFTSPAASIAHWPVVAGRMASSSHGLNRTAPTSSPRCLSNLQHTEKEVTMFAKTENQSGRTLTESATVLDPASGYATTMNTYNVTPERIEEGLEYLIRSAENVVRYQAGFVSFNFHVSVDRMQIVNYGQWQNRDAL